MLRLVRGSVTWSHSVRSFCVLSISIAAGLTATRASAAPADSIATPGFRPPQPTTVVVGQSSATPTSSPRIITATAKDKVYKLHLHGGLFAPIDVNATSPTIGMRLGRRVVSHVQLGMLLSWTFERRNLEQRVNDLPGLQPHRILARVDGQLVPAMAFIQVDLNETRFLVPYAGIAAGYEWLMLSANDFRNGATASATYSNYAWESWGGIGMRLGPDMTLDSEVFYNGGSLERDATDPSGQTSREAVHANGVGVRVGLNFLF